MLKRRTVRFDRFVAATGAATTPSSVERAICNRAAIQRRTRRRRLATHVAAAAHARDRGHERARARTHRRRLIAAKIRASPPAANRRAPRPTLALGLAALGQIVHGIIADRSDALARRPKRQQLAVSYGRTCAGATSRRCSAAEAISLKTGAANSPPKWPCANVVEHDQNHQPRIVGRQKADERRHQPISGNSRRWRD